MRIAMGRLGVGGRGVGALVDDQVNFILQTFIAGNGPTADPSAVRQSMLQETTATCTESFEPQTDCPWDCWSALRRSRSRHILQAEKADAIRN